MRLLIAVLDQALARRVRALLYRQDEKWRIVVASSGAEAVERLMLEPWELTLLQDGLLTTEGVAVLEWLERRAPICPPRVLYLTRRERGPACVDCVAPVQAEADKLCRLLTVLAKKPSPALAAARANEVAQATERFLNALAMNRALKGRRYAAWLLIRLVPSPAFGGRGMGEAYAACAKAFSTTPAAVERCLRVAVESVFTMGSIQGIERYFGATVDPERGKPTNRAFLMQAAAQLRLLLDRAAFGKQQRDAP